MQRPPPKIPDPRTQRLRARGLLAPRGAQQTPLGATAHDRAVRVGRVTSLGAPLAQRVAAANHATLSPHVSAALLAPSAALLWLAGVGWPVALGAGVGLYALTYFVARRFGAKPSSVEPSDVELAAQFDALLTAKAPNLPQDALATLRNIKASLATLLPNLSAAQTVAVLSTDDAFFVREAIRRYLPEAIDSLLSLPATELDVIHPDYGATPRQAFTQQLQTIEQRLSALCTQLTDAKARQLFRAQRLLERKSANDRG